MKKTLWFLSVISVLTLLLGCGNNNAEVIEDASLDDVSFPEDKKEGDTRPSIPALPTDGSDAVGALDLTDTLSYYNNNDLHDLPGQWNGYGVHYPSIFLSFHGNCMSRNCMSRLCCIYGEYDCIPTKPYRAVVIARNYILAKVVGIPPFSIWHIDIIKYDIRIRTFPCI